MMGDEYYVPPDSMGVGRYYITLVSLIFIRSVTRHRVLINTYQIKLARFNLRCISTLIHDYTIQHSYFYGGINKFHHQDFAFAQL